MDKKAKIARNGLMYYILVAILVCLLTPRPGRADRRCPLPQPISVGDKELDSQSIAINQLPPEVQNTVRGTVPDGYKISLMVKSNFSGESDTSDYLVFYTNDKKYRLVVIRRKPTGEVQTFLVLNYQNLKGFMQVWEGVDWGKYLESLSAEVGPDDLHIYQSPTGTVYAKTIGYRTSFCWETVISWQLEWFVAEQILFGTSDGFNYPVGPMDTRDPQGLVDILTASFPDGWKIDQGFQCQVGYTNNYSCVAPGSHLGEDWNGKGGGNTDLGYPIFAVARGEVIFAGNAGYRWNGIVVLRHRPPAGEDIYSFYGHLNIDSNARRADGSIIRTVTDILQQSAPGGLVEVEKGQLIGYIGPAPTKDTTAHLHFEIIVDPTIAYDKDQWDGYRLLYGRENQWLNPSKFIEENYSYSGEFAVGQRGSDRGANPVAFQESYDKNGGMEILGKPIGTVYHPQMRRNSSTRITGQAFQNGEIYYYLNSILEGKAFAVVGQIISKLKSFCPRQVEGEMSVINGSTPAFLSWAPGYPISDRSWQSEFSQYDTRFKFQNFDNGALEFHQTGPYAGEVFEIHGAIFNRWKELRYAAGPLGLPITDEREALKSPISGLTGRNNLFEGGAIHWIRETDKIFVIGLNQSIGNQKNIGKLITERYMAEGGSGGALGFPVNDDYLWQDGVRCDFENGCIIWTPSGGIRVLKW
jgi:murein DD-endopeptidase MepM/ murein hydrolase activator NlpD